jgi:hypothetical protein
MPMKEARQKPLQNTSFRRAAMSTDTRAFEGVPWISLLPGEERAALERVEADPEMEEWAALVAADRALEDDFSRPSRSSRLLVPLAVGGLLAAILLALDSSGTADRGLGTGGGSSATGSGEVAAVSAVPERNRVALASSVSPAVSGAAAPTNPRKPRGGGGSPTKPQKPPAGGGGGGGGSQTPPPASTPPPGGQITVPGIQVPSVQVPPITVPPVQVPGVQLPPVQLPPVSLPPVQLPPVQLPQLPPLLPPRGQ